MVCFFHETSKKTVQSVKSRDSGGPLTSPFPQTTAPFIFYSNNSNILLTKMNEIQPELVEITYLPK